MKSKSKIYRLLFENLPDASACCQIIFNEGDTSSDCIFLEINTAFKKMIGLKREKIIGQKASAVLSETEESDPFWIRIYDKVTSSEELVCFESYYEPQGRWYDVSLYRVESDCFTVIFYDITEHKQEEIEKEKEPGIDKKRTFLFEAEHYRANGRTIPVNMHLTFLRDNMGNVSGLLGVTRDISKLKKAEKELQETDLDNLKKINDSLGHNEGDHYIQAAAEVLKSSLRESDILARVGGDEFAVILPRTTLEAGRELVERIRHQIEIYNRQNTSSPTLSISIGIAVSTSGKQSLEKIFDKADDAMYEDKKEHQK